MSMSVRKFTICFTTSCPGGQRARSRTVFAENEDEAVAIVYLSHDGVTDIFSVSDESSWDIARTSR